MKISSHHFRIIMFLLPFFSWACITKRNVEALEYRYVSLQTVPRNKTGALTGKPSWAFHHHIDGPMPDSFYVYGNFDSILFKGPTSSRMFRKTDIRAESWKAKSHYGNLKFVGNYLAEHLPGLYASYYFSDDRRNILQALYTNPGTLVNAGMFHKDSVNVLEKDGIVIESSQ